MNIQSRYIISTAKAFLPSCCFSSGKIPACCLAVQASTCCTCTVPVYLKVEYLSRLFQHQCLTLVYLPAYVALGLGLFFFKFEGILGFVKHVHT